MSDIVERLRGIYRVHITDGLGKVDGNLEPDNENEFVRQFPSPPIQIEAADEIERLRTLLSEAEQRNKNARRVALGDAAITHETRVTELRNDPSSYKNGKITKSAKRASDFHERSAAVIRALQSEER